jgi:uncharacterized damage-inducible protein DinB
MDTIQILTRSFAFNRVRTLATLSDIEKLPDPRRALAFRLAPGRAHVGWQLMHIGITEELFASERLAPDKPPQWVELWPRFRGGSTPDDDVPGLAVIRDVLEQSRRRLLDTLSTYSEERLGEIPPALAHRNMTMLDVLHILGWHESHHQGQAHAMLNAFRAVST